jgi:hypothetical protein
MVIGLLSFSAEHHQVCSHHVVASHDEVGTQIALIPVEEAGGGGDVGADSGLPAGVEALQFEIGGHEEVDELGVCSCACSACVDVWGDIVDLLAVLFHHNRSSSGTGVCSQYDSISVLHSHDGGSRLLVGERLDCLFFLEELVPDWREAYLWVRVKSKPPSWSA